MAFGEFAESVNDRVEPANAAAEIYIGLDDLDSRGLRIRRWGKGSDVIGSKLRFRKPTATSGSIIEPPDPASVEKPFLPRGLPQQEHHELRREDTQQHHERIHRRVRHGGRVAAGRLLRKRKRRRIRHAAGQQPAELGIV